MIVWSYLAVILSVFVVTVISMPLVIKIAYKIGAVDKPNNRKVHTHMMPRLGGLAVFTTFILGLIYVNHGMGPFTGVILGAGVIFAIGLLDDIYQLSAWVKLLGQCAAAIIAIYFGVVVEFVTNPFNGLLSLGYLSIPVTFLWIVGVSNAINLIDGLDGLAGGVSAIAALTMGIVALMQGQIEVAFMAFILVAAISGFLPWNFYPAKIFMGDCGSNSLGFLLACIAILGTAKSAALISLFIPIVILGIPIFDTFFAIIRRINNHVPIFKPDKDHLHHRLMALGMSHRRSVCVIYMISGFFSGIAITLTFITDPRATLLLALLLMAIVWGAGKVGLLTGARDHAEIGRVKTVEPRKVEL